MRQALLAWLGPGSRIQTSYEPRRRGYFATSSRSLHTLRRGLPRRWVRRVTVLHQASGRYFIDLTPEFLARSLREQTDCWWNSRHEKASADFFSDVRRERIRRLPRGTVERDWIRGASLFIELALRLESLGVTPQPERHWRALAESFDELWRKVPLLAIPTSDLSQAVFVCLRHLERRSK